MKLIDKVRSTLKCQETEGPFELYVTRTPGYLWARLFAHLGVHPIVVTLTSIVIGGASGWFFYQRDLGMNVIGMLLLIWANWYDCADGQLARMTHKCTLIGRILDGFGGDVWFFSIYVFLCLRMQSDTIPFTDVAWGPWIWLLCSWAGFRCHARQCSISDYYRNIHMYYRLGRDRAELDSSDKVLAEMRALRWNSSEWFHKLYLFFYARYTQGQEAQVKHFHEMKSLLAERYGDDIPANLREEFCRQSRTLMPLTNILTFDTRVAVMFLSIGLGVPYVYPIVEITVFEVLKIYMIRRHENICKNICDKLLCHTA